MIWLLVIKLMTVDVNDNPRLIDVGTPVQYASLAQCQAAADKFNNSTHPQGQIAGCEQKQAH